jgi:hypothetical protein
MKAGTDAQIGNCKFYATASFPTGVLFVHEFQALQAGPFISDQALLPSRAISVTGLNQSAWLRMFDCRNQSVLRRIFILIEQIRMYQRIRRKLA